MLTARHYQSRADFSLEMAQKSKVRGVRRGYTKLYMYWRGLATIAAKQESIQQTPTIFARSMHDQTVRKYRLELTMAPPGLGRSKLITLLARMKMAAEEEGWPETI